ncbi:uncharacterized protein CXQ87_000601 [Candidozyma duobushaemuli]|uniref:RING-type domain-containing protein n=1 Tax=Candidozyma duobushaemuli TaxID=1231522 RepID=A0A2V1AII7_9ASCO|nr:uncharacterized protein CXQ87_000601 [[Candida] duobushaemulonis]PVH17708.1 hypothetical protein CXQ87_000601 [[Candida] duobushaemulonis]
MSEPEFTDVVSEVLEFDIDLILDYASSQTDTHPNQRKLKPNTEDNTKWIPFIDRQVRTRHRSPIALSHEALAVYSGKGLSNPKPGVFAFSTEAFGMRAGTIDPSLLILDAKQRSTLRKGTFMSLNFVNEIERTLVFNELRFITNRVKKCRNHVRVSRLELTITLDTKSSSIGVVLSYTVELEQSFFRYFSSDVSSHLVKVLRPSIIPYPTDNDTFYSSFENLPTDAHLFYKVITDNTSRMPPVTSSMAHPQLFTDLLPFQRKTVKWLLDKESVQFDESTKTTKVLPLLSSGLVSAVQDYPNVDHEKLDREIYPVLNKLCYGWNRVLFRNDICWVNELTGNIINREAIIKFLKDSTEELNKEPLPAAGLLSEEMGLGKTIEVIDLVLLNPRPKEEVGQEIKLQLQKEGDIRTVIKAKTTLITAPQTIIHQWYNEISKFSPGLSVTIYKGLGKYPELANIPRFVGEYLRCFDIVLLNYANMSSEADYANYTSKHSTTRGGKKRSSSEVRDEDNSQARDPLCADSYKAGFEFADREKVQSEALLSQKRYERAVMEEMAAKVRRQDLSKIPHIESWLVNLRQLCGNLQVGNLPAQKKKNNKFLLQGLPEMKTLESVLDDMMHGVLTDINEGERAVIGRLLDIAQLLEYVLLPEKVIEVLDNGLFEVSRLIHQIDMRLRWDISEFNNLKSFLKDKHILTSKELANITDDEDEDMVIDAEDTGKIKKEEVSAVTDAEIHDSVTKFNKLKERINADKIRLRSLKMLQHKCYFLLASAHFQVCDEEYQKKIAEKRVDFETLSSLESNVIGVKLLKSDEINYLRLQNGGLNNSDYERPNYADDFCATENATFEEQKVERHKHLESKFYELAEQSRKDMLRHSIKEVHDATTKRILNRPVMDRKKMVNDGVSSFPKTSKRLLKGVPIIDIEQWQALVGTTKLRQIMFQFTSVITELNNQAEVISSFVDQLIELLCNPLLSDEKSPDGEEYEKSLEDQDRAACLMVVISQLLMDRSNAILERKTRSTEVKKKQEKDLKEEARRSEISFEELLQDIRLLEHEMRQDVQGEAFHEAAEALRRIFENEKTCQELLQKEMSSCYNSVFNARVEYFKQLQQISDSVQGKTYCTEQDALEPKKVDSEVASHLMLFTAAQRRLTRAVSRLRYLSTLIPKNEALKQEAEESTDDSNDCVICQSQIVVGSLTPCGHKFCKACLEEWLKARSSCPICKTYTTRDTVHHFTHYKSDLKAQPVENGTHDTSSHKETAESAAVHQIYKQLDDETLRRISSIKLKNSYGSKVDLIVKQVLYLRSKDPQVQIVVFSQWQDLLVILAYAFDMAEISYVSAKGSQVANYKKKQEDPVEEFKRKDNIKTCFLLNAQAQASGLTLINAAHIFLCEPLVNTPVELQAISRIHRIGQTKITTVWMFGIENSVEENIVALGTRNRIEYLKANAKEAKKSKRKKRKIDSATLVSSVSESEVELGGDAPLADSELKTAESYALSLGLTSEKSTGKVFSGISESVSDSDLRQVYFGNVEET